MTAGNRSFSWVTGFLLAVPLIGLTVWLAAGGWHRSFGPDRFATAVSEAPAVTPDSYLVGLPPPQGDFPAPRLFERVNGAADALIAAGCGRLLFWRMDDPAAEVEVLVFETDDGAATTLTGDAGPNRTPGPGDEGIVSDQAIFFRRGRFYVRVVAEPGAPVDPDRLLDLAGRFDRSLQTSRATARATGGSS